MNIIPTMHNTHVYEHEHTINKSCNLLEVLVRSMSAIYPFNFNHVCSYRLSILRRILCCYTRRAPTAGHRPAVGARLVSWNCFTISVCVYVCMYVCMYICLSVYVCMYVCMYICLSFRTHVSKPFTWSLKAACMQTINAKQSLYYTHAQVSSASKVCFFPNRKPGVATIHRLRSQLS